MIRAVFLLVLPCLLHGAQSLDRLIEELRAVRHIETVAISPDGGKVAWVEKTPSGAAGIYLSEAHPDGKPPRRVADGREVAWSPDSRRLAFLSDKDERNQLQLYVSDATGRSPRRLTSLRGFLADPRWSPDGKTIAFLFTENAPREGGPLVAVTPDAGVVESKIYEQRIATMEASGGGSPRQISPPDLYVYEYDWSPDGRGFAATAAPGPGDNNWYIAKLYVFHSDAARVIAQPSMQMAFPRWSPDGTTVAFIAGLMSDEGSTGGDIYTVPASGGDSPPKNVTPGLPASAAWLAWTPDSRRILFGEIADGATAFAWVEPATGTVRTLWKGDEAVSARVEASILSMSADQKTSAAIRRSWTQPPEVWAGPIGAWRQVTHLNQNRKPQWGSSKSIHWRSDLFNIQGWLLYPRELDLSRRYPLVVSVHGGPAAAFLPHWPHLGFDMSVLSGQGYFVLLPNPRGSFGAGEEFTRANVKDFGGGDLRDILAGVDEVIRTAPVDPKRVGITGWSYGGFMTMWAVTQTDRFRAAVAGAGLANWQSYYGENSIDQWMLPYFGASVYDDPAVYAKSSPINFIKQAKTPTLILVGDRDGEVPAPQSYEFWHALKTLGVKTRLVVYPNEGHRISRPEHQKDILERLVAWFGEHLQS